MCFFLNAIQVQKMFLQLKMYINTTFALHFSPNFVYLVSHSREIMSKAVYLKAFNNYNFFLRVIMNACNNFNFFKTNKTFFENKI